MAEFYAVGSGATKGTDLGPKTFYGIFLDALTGQLRIDVIGSGEAPVKLPDPNNQSVSDYRQYIFTEDTLDFAIDDNGHLLLTIY